MTLNGVGPLISMKRNKQLLSNFEGWNHKKFKHIEDWGMSQVASKESVWNYLEEAAERWSTENSFCQNR